MSTVRYFNSIPHIVRFGQHDDDMSWMLFWRNGVRFEITVNHSEVKNTRFERKWVDLNKANNEATDTNDPCEWVHRWELLCDCLIFQCLDVLEQVAPDEKVGWESFKDYLHTPGYKIKVIANEETYDAEGQLEDGCTIQGAYEATPLPAEEIGIALDGLNRYRSEDLLVVDKESNWRCAPHRVQAPDGGLFELAQVESYSFFVGTGEVVNRSLEKIRAHLNIHEHCREQPLGYPSRVPQVLGYVTDDTDPQEKKEEDKNRIDVGLEEIHSGSEPRTLIAGILLTDFPSSRTLWDLVRDSKDNNALLLMIKANKNQWKSQTLAIIKDIHARGMACGEPENNQYSPYVINEHSINIDNAQEVWLDSCIKHFKTESSAVGFGIVKTKDLNAVGRLFDEWLTEEIAKTERHQIKRKFNI